MRRRHKDSDGGQNGLRALEIRLTAVLLSLTVTTVHPRCCRGNFFFKSEEGDAAMDTWFISEEASVLHGLSL